ncbi:hypothetical protein HA402_007073 [Bradysia odoriphaga]|nr:hypothetical protein HA402_007073 [Bradysia odoriphaga]
MVTMIMLRTLHKDIARYIQMECGEDAQEEFGWKLVHGDVFRPPRKGMLLSVFLGSGVQVLFMSLVTLAFACLGSLANRGALMTCAMVLFGGIKWNSNVLLTSMLSPGVVFGLFFVMILVLWSKGSSGAVPFSTFLALLALWFGVSVPLTSIGAYFGFRKRRSAVFAELDRLREEIWQNSSADAYFQRQQNNSDNATPELKKRFFEVMRNIAKEINGATQFINDIEVRRNNGHRAPPPRLLDLCMAPGGFSEEVR